jgi:hypothetical protein
VGGFLPISPTIYRHAVLGWIEQMDHFICSVACDATLVQRFLAHEDEYEDLNVRVI